MVLLPSSSSSSFLDSFIRFFLFVDSVVHFAVGSFLFLFPHSFALLLLNRPSDGVHWHLLRCVGGQLVASASLGWRATSARRPPEVRSACLVLRLLGHILCAFLFLHTRSVHPDLIPAPFLRQLIWFSLGSVSVCFVLLVVSGWPIGDNLYAENRWGNILYQIDTIAAVAIGIAWVLAPHWLLHRQVRVPMDSSHAFCGQLLGIMFVASQVISAHALHWHQQADRAMAAETRAVVCLCILSAQFWSQIAYGKHWSDKHWVGICLFSIWTLICILYRTCLWLSGADRQLKNANGEIGTALISNGGTRSHLPMKKVA